MNSFTISAVVGSILLACTPVALAQFGAGPRYDPASVSSLVDRVHSDLDHAYGDFHFSKDDRNRLNQAEKNLRDFAQKWNNRKFDKGELDEAIGSIQGVLDHNRLPQDDRSAISDDVSQLRDMRQAYDRHEIGE